MGEMKTLQARCATSEFVERLDIVFDEKNGKIYSVSFAQKTAEEVDYYYGDECLLFAGMGDIHIHAREDISGKNNYKEDFSSACCAAINGGLAHVADMPNNPIPPIDDQSYLQKLMLTKDLELPFLLYAGIGPETNPLSFTVPYKVYMGPSVGELFFKDNESLEVVLERYRGQFVSFHCEDPEILEESKGESSHETRRPVRAELMATSLALKLIKKYGLKGKLCHYSSGEGLKEIIKAKKAGVDVTCEVTPQHLYYSIEKIKKERPSELGFFQMNPPIRTEQDRFALLYALKEGIIDYLATDHAPHSREEKEKGTSGMPGLDTYGPFVTWLILDQGVDPRVIAKVCSEGPGRFFNQFLFGLNQQLERAGRFGKGFGFLKRGYNASFTILNLEKPSVITEEMIKSKAKWSPFLGETFPGSIEALFHSGKRL